MITISADAIFGGGGTQDHRVLETLAMYLR